MRIETKKLTVLSILAVIAYLVMVVGRIPVVLFLSYDPKDVIITVGGLLYGPFSAFLVSFVVSFIEMFTVSDTGIIGAIMNIISSCSFACTASLIYKMKRDKRSAVLGLIVACLVATSVMMLWNYFIVPIYMGYPREAVAKLLIPAFLPFNLIKTGLNAAITMLLYKPLITVLRRAKLMPSGNESTAVKGKISVGTILVSCFVIVSCILFILVLQGKI